MINVAVSFFKKKLTNTYDSKIVKRLSISVTLDSKCIVVWLHCLVKNLQLQLSEADIVILTD